MSRATGRRTLSWIVPLLLGFGGVGQSQQFFDDFQDGELFDCAPVCWDRATCIPGHFDIVDGDLVMRDPVWTDVGLTLTPFFFDDVSVRTQTVSGVGQWVYVVAHAKPNPCGEAYLGGLNPNTGAVFLAKWDVEADEPLKTLGSFLLPDYVPGDGYVLQLDTVGDFVCFRAWNADDEMPEEPQIEVEETTLREGKVGVVFRPWGPGDLAVFRYFEVSSPAPTEFRRGDCTDDGKIDISDGVCILHWLFRAEGDPGCVAALNTNGDADVDLSDAVYLLRFLFIVGPPPAVPHPNCGPGRLPTDEALGCVDPPDCQ